MSGDELSAAAAAVDDDASEVALLTGRWVRRRSDCRGSNRGRDSQIQSVIRHIVCGDLETACYVSPRALIDRISTSVK